jgi:hypothetical protein
LISSKEDKALLTEKTPVEGTRVRALSVPSIAGLTFLLLGGSREEEEKSAGLEFSCEVSSELS